MLTLVYANALGTYCATFGTEVVCVCIEGYGNNLAAFCWEQVACARDAWFTRYGVHELVGNGCSKTPPDTAAD